MRDIIHPLHPILGVGPILKNRRVDNAAAESLVFLSLLGQKPPTGGGRWPAVVAARWWPVVVVANSRRMTNGKTVCVVRTAPEADVFVSSQWSTCTPSAQKKC